MSMQTRIHEKFTKKEMNTFESYMAGFMPLKSDNKQHVFEPTVSTRVKASIPEQF